MSNKFIYYVYAYLRKDGTPYYIGKGKEYRAYVKHGCIHVPKDRKRIIFLERNLSEVGALAIERRMIEWYGRKDNGNGILHNRTDGGEGASGGTPWNKGKSLPANMRDKIANSLAGIKRSSDTRAKMQVSNKRPHTEETKMKMSAARRGVPKPKTVCRLCDRKEMTIQHFSQWQARVATFPLNAVEQL